MSQAATEDEVGDLDASVGYLLKRAAAALRSAMETALRPLDLTVPQYACLEQLRRHPGWSNTELARATFVTRQSMHGVLVGLQERELVTRPDVAPLGRVLPTRLTDLGQEHLRAASRAVRVVEQRMARDLDDRERDELCVRLHTVIAALG